MLWLMPAVQHVKFKIENINVYHKVLFYAVVKGIKTSLPRIWTLP